MAAAWGRSELNRNADRRGTRDVWPRHGWARDSMNRPEAAFRRTATDSCSSLVDFSRLLACVGFNRFVFAELTCSVGFFVAAISMSRGLSCRVLGCLSFSKVRNEDACI